MELNSIQYDAKKFTLEDGQTNYDVKANVAELFDNIKVARRVVIKSDQTLTFRFNNVNLPTFEMVVSQNKNESPFQMPENFMSIVNIFVTNASGSTANIEIILA